MQLDPKNDATRHMAAKCSDCGAAFVVLTIPPGGMPIEIATARMDAAVCPDCAGKSLTYGLNETHTAAVERLRREATQD